MNSTMDNPRKSAIEYMKSSVPRQLWSDNVAFIQDLRQKITDHPIAKHEIINLLNDGLISKKDMITIQLEYRHAIVQIFTDAILAAQHLSKQLEPRLYPGSKMHSRFLLTLNILDEFGYRPGFDRNQYYQGNSRYSHYLLYEQLLDDYDVTQQQRCSYQPSSIAEELKNFLEDSYDNFAKVCALLAVAEEEVIIFSPPLRRNTKALGIDVSSGYYFVHGTSSDDLTHAYDDAHENDLWTILYQALTPEMYAEIETACIKYCEMWNTFWSRQLALINYEKIKIGKEQNLETEL